MNGMIVILGPTASGKTTLAAALAAEIGGEVISADSRQVYRRMDIGTGKDLDDYVVDGKTIPYHLIDICEPGSKYNLFRYQEDFLRAYQQVIARQHVPILCGGTGLYIEAVLKGYNLSPVPQNQELRTKLENKTLDELTIILRDLKDLNGSHMHNETDVDTAQRAIRAIEIEEYNRTHPTERRNFPEIHATVFGVDIEREERRRKITARLRQRLEQGMIEEVRQLLDSGIPAEDLIYYGLEYKYVTEYVIGRISYDEMFRQLEIAIHQFAKRQMTWFRGMEKRGVAIQWINAMWPTAQKVSFIKSKIQTPNSQWPILNP